MPRKILTLVGTRPECIKLSAVIDELARHTKHVLVHTGQNYDHELNGVFFEQLALPQPDHFLGVAADTAAATVGRVIERTDEVLREERPDAMLILGDTNSCMGVYAAKRLKIPVFHMEAGNRCFDQCVPEEINRKLIDHMSDINMPYTEHARRYLLAEGLPPERIIKTGSPMREVLQRHAAAIDAASAHAHMGLEPGRYFVLSCHREENVDAPERLERLRRCLEALDTAFGLPVVFPVHPRTLARLSTPGAPALPPSVIRSKALGFFEYVSLQKNAFCVLSDSGTLTEESALLDIPAVMLRQTHERPEGMDMGTLLMSDLDPQSVVDAVRVATAPSNLAMARRFALPDDYAPCDVSRKVTRIILSYIDYVNRTVWRRND
ncbi:non-hydrolyzing UDP-N-acetylglucosamine 2-epimerase [Nitratidesulfovibrio vulgaris]|uniref:non-hydrolyzing UDP-N-acetylglucosamine 2-epimerase n=1 Tax=Nitratidesulfovibrio vulgaris TaxID=881 RepID=UPI002301E94D|nr:UDP-N-acetylglucosamine 2-epimerase (non-hydrolyzing) [Nitratidesulfovibrio vulgaris]WCB46374.1 UDP-N-acetylglucosamine 2-epimerase (non-hydrolyzing) [Nitratidesulfovibrio vulgaris]